MRKALFWLMPPVYSLAGVYHFIDPVFYDRLMPSWIPQHALLILVSGIIEILLGLALYLPQTRKISAWLIIAMLVVFLFVIHIPDTISFYGTNAKWFWISLARIPLQFYLIWWAKKFTRTYQRK
ncbi:MAG TPA: DoxX family protein [Bacteroidia bacterium]|jgi:uncharacterized membrane protein|nr:DoxX family protein [Bacteroidia bacterium]